jgi:hypothetical protein
MSKYTCSGCGIEWVWFCGGPETIKYPMTHTCDECGATTVQDDPHPELRNFWTPFRVDALQWDDDETTPAKKDA